MADTNRPVINDLRIERAETNISLTFSAGRGLPSFSFARRVLSPEQISAISIGDGIAFDELKLAFLLESIENPHAEIKIQVSPSEVEVSTGLYYFYMTVPDNILVNESKASFLPDERVLRIALRVRKPDEEDEELN